MFCKCRLTATSVQVVIRIPIRHPSSLRHVSHINLATNTSSASRYLEALPGRLWTSSSSPALSGCRCGFVQQSRSWSSRHRRQIGLPHLRHLTKLLLSCGLRIVPQTTHLVACCLTITSPSSPRLLPVPVIIIWSSGARSQLLVLHTVPCLFHTSRSVFSQQIQTPCTSAPSRRSSEIHHGRCFRSTSSTVQSGIIQKVLPLARPPSISVTLIAWT